ncbi:MAG: hypothetical protein QOJ99_4277 [Bryobacterales bacterium]|jgi:hypothetical protein|nr:hypothetical protein [Bryobacterales bacterium]
MNVGSSLKDVGAGHGATGNMIIIGIATAGNAIITDAIATIAGSY